MTSLGWPVINTRKRGHSPSGKNNTNRDGYYALYIANIPPQWDHFQIKLFVQENTVSSAISDDIKFIEVLNDNNGARKGACLIKFGSLGSCKAALHQMMGTAVNGKKIVIIEDITGNLRDQLVTKDMNQHDKRTKLENDNSSQTGSSSSMNTYGLSTKFLDSLNIVPPLVTRVFVANLHFNVTTSKLTEVFGLAGQVVMATIYKQKNGSSTGKAMVEYDHPVEAVQAIAMFNNQELFEREMTVKMDHSIQNHKTLPVGLKNIGAGLGYNGQPLRGIRNHVEFQALKQELLKSNGTDSSDVPETNQTLKEQSALGNYSNEVSNWNTNQQSTSMWNTNIVPSMITQSLVNNAQQSLVQLLQQGGMGLGTLATLGGQMATTNLQYGAPVQLNVPNLMQAQDHSIIPENRGFDVTNNDVAMQKRGDMVVFENLPPSVTMSVLRDKMREVGDLKFAELTGNGTAIVRFTSSDDAERCHKIFDRSRVDGQTIIVKYI